MRAIRLALTLVAALLALPLSAATEDDILPVEQAFVLKTTVAARDRVEFSWTIADDYYLYRERIKVKSETPGVELGALTTPPGEKKHDEFLGDVETYHQSASASQALVIADPALREAVLRVSIQGCHEVDPKICYPPHATRVTVNLPAAAAATSSLAAPAASTSAGSLLGSRSDPSASGVEKVPLPDTEAFRFEAIASSPQALLMRFTMADGYYLYRDRTRVVSLVAEGGPELARAGALQWPASVPHTDEHFGQVQVYFGVVEVPLPLERLSTAAGRLALTTEFQGCQDDGICYPPMTRTVAVDLPAGGTLGAASPATNAAVAPTNPDRFAAALEGSGWFKIIALFFVAGLGLAFTPCVFPMIPILSGIIAGAGEDLTRRRALVLSLVYVLASTVIFTLAGVIAGLAGQNLQILFQQTWILVAFAGVFVALAFSMFGFYELQLPASFQSRIADMSNRQQSGSLVGVAIMGALSALIVGPCVAPPLAAAVVYIGQQQDPVLGGLALFAMGLGMGAPLVAFGAGAGELLPRAGEWMDRVKHVFGVVFLLLALWMLERVMEPRHVLLVLGAILVGSGVYLGALERLPDYSKGWHKLQKSVGVLLFVLGLAQFVGGLAGANDYLAPLRGLMGGGGAATAGSHAPFRPIKSSADLDRELAAATAAGRPLLLDFYADWCVSCKEMERDTFTDARVQRALAGFVAVQADVTANDDLDQALMKRFNIIGPPGTLFFGSDGKPREELRLVGFEAAEPFAERLARAAK